MRRGYAVGTMRELADSDVTKVAGGFRFLEGPVWVRQKGKLIFSDIPADTLHEYDPATKKTAVYRTPSGNANGNTLDGEGRLITCHHSLRCVTRTEHDGKVTTLVSHYEGKKLNSPNDVVVHSSGLILFTDPPYGLKGQTEGKELAVQNIFCLDASSGVLVSLYDKMMAPNGLCLSPDEKVLYVAHSAKPAAVWAYDVKFWLSDDGTPHLALENARSLFDISPGVPDGMRVDVEGNVWVTAGDGAQIFSAKGELLGKIAVPESPANIAFGGDDLKDVYLTARTGLYHVRSKVAGVR